VAFYGKHSSYSISKLFTFFLKDTKEESIENILSKRVEIKMNLLENRFWVNYLSNVFNYFDVILFHQFLIDHNEHDFAKFDEMALNALTAITMASYADGEVDEKEKAIFDVCLASANLTDKDREHIQSIFEKGADFSDFTPNLKHNSLLKRYILDISTFVIFSNSDAHNEEVDFIHELCLYLNFDLVEKNNAYALTEQFILSNQDKIPFLNENSTLEKIYSRFSKRWIKILGRNKDKLALEVKQSKELVYLIRKSTTKELTKEEKELVKSQFKDIVRSMPSLAIFMLPGGAFLLPLVLKIIPDLIPSAFRDNEVED
jgi:tellurite resistance protein